MSHIYKKLTTDQITQLEAQAGNEAAKLIDDLLDKSVDPDLIQSAVAVWLEDHPEATTTVEDGAITEAKLDSDLQKTLSGLTDAVITPEMFGAKGDGTTDDTVALRACIVSGANVRLTGVYKITDTLDFSNKHDITWTGGKITRAADQLFNTISGSGCYNITLRLIEFDGNGNNDGEYEWKTNMQAAVILASQCKNIALERCKIVNHHYGVFINGADAEGAVSFDRTSYNGFITGCTFHNCKTGVDTYGKNVLIESCLFSENEKSVILEPNETPSGGDPMAAQYWYTAMAACAVKNNLFIDNSDSDITIQANSYSVIVSGNCHINYTAALRSESPALRALLIENNTYVYQKQQTITASKPYLYIPTLLVSSGQVLNNHFDECFLGVFAQAGCTIRGNVFKKPHIGAVTVYEIIANTDAILMEGNSVLGFVRDQQAWWACVPFTVFTSQGTILISDTYAESDAAPIYFVSGTTGIIRNLTSTHEQGAITKTSGLYEYTNS